MYLTLLLLALIPGGLADAPAIDDPAGTLSVHADLDSATCRTSGAETALFDFRVGFHNCDYISCSSCEWCCEEACPWGDPCLGNCWDDCLATCS